MEYIAELSREGRRTLIEFRDCPGCQTFAGPGEDAGELAREALEGWLEVHLERGAAPPRPTARRLGPKSMRVRVTPSLAIALQLRWCRQDLGLSQAQLGKRLGVTRQQAASLESPGANLRLATLERAAEALDVVLDIELQPPSKGRSRRARVTATTR